VILALDGVPVGTQSELVQERNKHQQGEAFTLTILRDGSEMNINARFKECSEEEVEQWRERQESHEMRMEKMEKRMEEMHIRMAEKFEKFEQIEAKERPILGVYENNDISKPGLVIGSVISGKGAETAGLQAGDVVTKVDGKTVTGGGTLRTALTGHQPGDRVMVEYQRDGQTLQTEVTLSKDRSYYSYTAKRDPCAVFIGVYTGESGAAEGRGVKVTGIVDETPAKQSGVQPGDVILALDDQPVNDHIELLRERNKHRPGDAFRLTVDRDGAIITIEATFKTCQTIAPEKEKVEVIAEEKKAEQRDGPVNVETMLPLESLELYPNPTTGPVNVRFEAEAVPTTVRIMDASGKTVYSKVMNQFNGSFSEQINLFGNTPGMYMLSIQQDKKVSTRKIVLMPGA
jgi:C-terminal processing protease CtpA/Prc